MKTCLILLLLFAFFAAGSVAQTVAPVTRLANVKTVYVDEASFRFAFSSCGTSAGGMILPCPKHARERLEFLNSLKEWTAKSGFTLVDDETIADGVVRGELSIDDRAEIVTDDHTLRTSKYQIEWVVKAWIVNNAGKRIWLRGAGYPSVSHGWSSKAKIEGKKLAKAIQFDFKKGR